MATPPRITSRRPRRHPQGRPLRRPLHPERRPNHRRRIDRRPHRPSSPACENYLHRFITHLPKGDDCQSRVRSVIEKPPITRNKLATDDMADAQLIWDYHLLNHELRPADVGIGLGSHDLGVATFAAQLYQLGLFPTLVFTGANSPTTTARFPSGEAVQYREHAVELLECPRAPSWSSLLPPTPDRTSPSPRPPGSHPDPVESVLLVCKPYMERRALATCQKLWPGVDVVCASEPI